MDWYLYSEVFLGLSGHYICDKFNLNVAILCVKEFPAKKKRKLIL